MARPKSAASAAAGHAGKSTREMLLDIAGELLAEVGIERISTNMICRRAGVTPPTLYHYFADKYAVLEALGARLMDRQNQVLFAWIERHAGQGIEAYTDHLEELLYETTRVTWAEPGGTWIERALHATPSLTHVRVQSHEYVTDRLTDALAPLLPELTRQELWLRMRVGVEFGYGATEMASEASDSERAAIFAEAARIQRLGILDTRPTPTRALRQGDA
ncbi:TetR/AcrR family transcriptional regulator [Phenylobacterium sp.]|uniref:TetR/AcrR family transcriptional regulator n=1 Tax=Phenylobacterium sp. TaxID=1871053 RepID=UPI000AD53F6C